MVNTESYLSQNKSADRTQNGTLRLTFIIPARGRWVKSLNLLSFQLLWWWQLHEGSCPEENGLGEDNGLALVLTPTGAFVHGYHLKKDKHLVKDLR